jgi:hypothetical protein
MAKAWYFNETKIEPLHNALVIVHSFIGFLLFGGDIL